MTPASMLRLHFTKPHVKYHFGCDVTRFTKNRIQKPNSPNSVRGSWCWERKKLSFLPFQWCSLSPTSTRWVEHRLFWTAVSPPKLTSTNHKKDVGIHVALLVDSKWETAKCSSVRHEWSWFYFSRLWLQGGGAWLCLLQVHSWDEGWDLHVYAENSHGCHWETFKIVLQTTT